MTNYFVKDPLEDIGWLNLLNERKQNAGENKSTSAIIEAAHHGNIEILPRFPDSARHAQTSTPKNNQIEDRHENLTPFVKIRLKGESSIQYRYSKNADCMKIQIKLCRYTSSNEETSV